MTAVPIDLGWQVFTYALSAALPRIGPSCLNADIPLNGSELRFRFDRTAMPKV
jgi:hypothetical protein